MRDPLEQFDRIRTWLGEGSDTSEKTSVSGEGTTGIASMGEGDRRTIAAIVDDLTGFLSEASDGLRSLLSSPPDVSLLEDWFAAADVHLSLIWKEWTELVEILRRNDIWDDEGLFLSAYQRRGDEDEGMTQPQQSGGAASDG